MFKVDGIMHLEYLVKYIVDIILNYSDLLFDNMNNKTYILIMTDKNILKEIFRDSKGNEHTGQALLKGVEYVREYYVKINNECIDNALDKTTYINTDYISVRDYVSMRYDENIRGLNGEKDFRSVAFNQRLNFYFTGDCIGILP